MSTANLSLEEREAIAQLAAHMPVPRAACIDAMNLVQAKHRYISDNVLSEIAALLGMSTAELDEVATFYNLNFRRPVGEKVLMLCDSITCWMMGRDALAVRITSKLGIQPGETTGDGRFTFLPIVCLGHCDHAPALLLDGELHGDVTPAALDAMLQP